MKLSVIVPVFNEEATISELLGAVERSIASCNDLINDYEIIVIDDASVDNTKQILAYKCLKNSKIKVFTQERNQGKGAALRLGFQKAQGEVYLIQDADLEYDPKDYRSLIGPIAENRADVVYGSRFKGGLVRALYFSHYLGNIFLTFLSNLLTNLNLSDIETGYKVFRGEIARNLILKSNRFSIEPELTAKIAKLPEVRVYEVPISYYGRTYLEGKKIHWWDGLSALWSIFYFNLLVDFDGSFLPAIKEYQNSLRLSKGNKNCDN